MKRKRNQLIIYRETLATKHARANMPENDKNIFTPILRLENLQANFKTPYNCYLHIIGEKGTVI